MWNVTLSAKFSNWVGVSLCTYKCHICDSGFPSALMFFTGSWVWLDCGHFSWIFSSSHFLYTKLIPNYVLHLKNQEILCLLSTSKIHPIFNVLQLATVYPRWNTCNTAPFVSQNYLSSLSFNEIWPVFLMKEFVRSPDSSVSQINANYIHINPCRLLYVFFNLS